MPGLLTDACGDPIEYSQKVGCDSIFDLAPIDAPPEQPLERGHASIRDATRHDQIEVLQVCRDVERKAMTGYPTPDANTNCRKLLAVDPDTGEPGDSCCVDSVVGGRTDQHFFEIPHVAVHVTTIGTKIENRIANDLTGPMIGNVATPPGLVHVDVQSVENFRLGKNVRPSPVAADA